MNSIYLGEKKISLIIYDFDGVMTDNKVTLTQEGIEMVTVSRGDGLAVRLLREAGIMQMIVSTECNKVVEQRARKLSIPVVYGTTNKVEAVLNICKEKNIMLNEVLYIGNDINDREIMLKVGIRGCPADAEKEILEISEWISEENGGNGVIRDLFRYLCIK